jgi:acyl-coenzyme A thioesterase 13
LIFFSLKKKLKPIFAPENGGKCVCEMSLSGNHTNIGSVLHGGLTASLIDSVTTAALFNTPIRKTGVSVNLNVSYMKAAKINEKIIINAYVKQIGNKLAFLEANIYRANQAQSEYTQEFFDSLSELKLIASGSHTKYILD